MSTQKRQASVLGSTLTSLTLNSDLSSSEEETSDADDEDFDDFQQAKGTGESADLTDNDNEKGKNKQTSSKDKEGVDLEVKKSEKPSKPRVRMKTLTIDGQLVYFCVLCDKVFTRRKDKLNHELAHSSETVLTCTECGKEYFHESSLTYHMRSHDADQLHLCDLCPKMFAQGHHLKTHILSHSQPTEFTCKTCYQDFALASDLSEHIRSKIKEEMTLHWCKMCKIYFCRNHSEVKNVSRLHAYRCTACNELFYSQKKLRLHMKKYAHKSFDKPKVLEPLAAEEMYSQRGTAGLKKGESNNASKLTASSSNVDKEGRKRCLNDYENNKPLSKRRRFPSKCFGSEAVQSSSSLQDSSPEMKAITNLTLKSPFKGRKGKPYCKKCNKSFKDVSDLDSHKLLAHGETPKYFACEICHQRFPSQQQCDSHKSQHRKEEMHTCPMCSQDFFHSAELTQHLKEHSGDFPYKCNQCGKSFRLKLQLIQHIRLHIPQTPVACDKCGLQVSCRKDLDEHLLQAHDEEEEFKCHLCSKVFQFRYKLQNHLRLHTNVKTFQCYICHKSFATKHYLQRHLQIHLRQGMDVDMTNIIKKEAEDMSSLENVTNDESEMARFFDPNVKEDFEASLNSTIQSLKKLTENDHRRFRSKDNVLKLNFRKVREDMSSDSEESACSVLTRESEKSDPFRFSSDGSDSFKLTMAKERRKLRKRRQLSRLALYNKLNALKNEQIDEKETEIVAAEVVIEEEEDEVVRDMTVEINGIESFLDNEVTIFVDLKEVQPCCDSSDLSIRNTDLTDKENQLPGQESILQHLDNYNRARLQCDDQREENDGQTLVLDIEMDDETLSEYFNQDKDIQSVKDPSDCRHKVDPIRCNIKDNASYAEDKSKLLSGTMSSQHSLSQEKPDGVLPGRSTDVSEKHQKSPSIMDNWTPSDPSKYTYKPANTYLSEKDNQPAQTSLKSMEPLQSLHDMTAQIQSQKNDNDKASQFQDKRNDNHTNLSLQSKAKHDRKKTPSFNQNLISDEPVNNNVKYMSKSQVTPMVSSAHGIVNKPCGLHSQKNTKADSMTASKESSLENHRLAAQNVKPDVHDSCSKRGKERSAWNIPPSVPKSHVFNSPSIPSAISHSHTSSHNSGSLQKVNRTPEASSLPLKGNIILKPTSPFQVSEPQVQALPFTPTSSLCHGNESTHDIIHLTGNVRGATPKEFQPPVIANSPSRSYQSNFVPSSHIFSAGTTSVCVPNIDSLKTPPRVSSNHSVTSFRLPHCNSPRSSAISNSSTSGQLFDTKNPTLRNINMMELVASNNNSGIPHTPAPLFAGPNINVNNLQENQNMNAIANFLRPVTPSSILPSQLGALSSNVYPDCAVIPPKPNHILISDNPHPSLASNPDLSLLNNFGSLAPTLGSMGPPMSLNLDFGLSNISGLGPVSNFSHVNTANPGMAGPSLPLPVSNFRGLDPMPLTNLNPNPLTLCNMDLVANAQSVAPRPMNNVNPVNFLPFGGTCLNPLSSAVPPFNSDFNFHSGAVLPPGAGSGGIPIASSNLLSNPQLPLGPVNFPLGTPLMPESGILPTHPMGIMGGMNSGPFFPM